MGRRGLAGALVCWVLVLPGCSGQQGEAARVVAGRPTPAATQASACPLFPANAIFNTRIDALPAHARSAEWVQAIGARTRFHADWGFNDNPNLPDYHGIPTNTIDGSAGSTSWPLVTLEVPHESDCGVRSNGSITVRQGCSGSLATQSRFPFPTSGMLIEGGNGAGNTGDRHVLVKDTGTCRLWETAYAYANGDGTWRAFSIAQWDLQSNAIRPATWTSSDAAGLPIAPFLVRADEAQSGEIRHALRVTFRNGVMSTRGFEWPATHAAGSGGNIPFGAVMRLKGNFVINPAWSTQAKAIALAMQRYGLYVVDNGSDLFVQGEPSARWHADIHDQLRSIRMSDFEFVDLGPIKARPGFSDQSYAVPAAP